MQLAGIDVSMGELDLTSAVTRYCISVWTIRSYTHLSSRVQGYKVKYISYMLSL
jgi:hypothetical protein